MMGTAAGCRSDGRDTASGKPVAGGVSGRPATAGSASASPTSNPAWSLFPLPTGTPAARSGSPSRNRSHLVNQHEIDSYVLTPKDVPGDNLSTLAGRTTAGTEWPVTLFADNLPRISPAACQHVYENMNQASAYRQYARADDVLGGRDHVRVGLIAYRPADAPKVLADLRAALPRCTAFTGPVDKTESLEHPQLLPDPHLGDEVLEYGITTFAACARYPADTPMNDMGRPDLPDLPGPVPPKG